MSEAARGRWWPPVCGAIIALFLWATTAAAGAVAPQPRILGGDPVTPGHHGYVVSLEALDSDGHFCGGALVAPRLVLTAAHCVVGGHAGLTARVGANDLTKPGEGERIAVDAVDVHPNYDPTAEAGGYDIAVLTLAHDAQAAPVRVASPYRGERGYWRNGAVATALGWGFDEHDECCGALRSVRVPILSDLVVPTDPFGDPLGFSPETMLATGGDGGGRGTCQGDSGGPLVVDRAGDPLLVALVSWGFGCAEVNAPEIQTRVASAPLYDWVAGFLGLSGSTGDLNSDGRSDVVLSDAAGVAVLTSAGAGFERRVASGALEGVPALGDFDGDGAPELWLVRDGGLAIYRLNSGDGSVARLHRQSDLMSTRVTPLVGDLDGDGRAEICFSSGVDGVGGGYVSIQSFTGTLFQELDLMIGRVGIDGQSATLGDMTGDGLDDLVIFNQATYGPENTVWASLPTNGRNEPLYVETISIADDFGAPGESVAVGQFDGVGGLDMVAARDGWARVAVGGPDAWVESVWTVGLSPIGRLLVGDVDGDGLDDLINLIGDGTGAIEVSRSDGSGFGPAEVWGIDAPPG